VTAEQAPTVAGEVTWDSAGGGINVHITTTKFTFAPDAAGDSYVLGEGHAHLSIDGNDVGRAYGDWVYIPTASFGDGPHTLAIALEASDHKDYMVGVDEDNGEDVEAEVDFSIPTGAGFSTGAHGHEDSSGSASAWLWGLGGLVIGGGAVAAVYSTRTREPAEPMKVR
jgi:hypothetical protein